MNLLFSPHNDDESLFCHFTIQRENPLVVIVFDSHIQGKREVERGGVNVGPAMRRNETIAALAEVPTLPPLFMGFSDLLDEPPILPSALRNLLERHKPEKVWAPAVEKGGHAQHNYVGRVVAELFPKVQPYLTYIRGKGKSRSENEVVPEPWMIPNKLRALAHYESQILTENCREWFMNDLREYYA